MIRNSDIKFAYRISDISCIHFAATSKGAAARHQTGKQAGRSSNEGFSKEAAVRG